MAPTEAEAAAIVEPRPRRPGCIVCVAHVLRYTPYTKALVGDLVGSGRIGRIVVCLQHLKPVGWWHFAHSYVGWQPAPRAGLVPLAADGQVLPRPRLARAMSSAPRPQSGSPRSAGSSSLLRPQEPPARRRVARCTDCAVEPDCSYSAKQIYLDHADEPNAQRWPLDVLAVEVNRDLDHRGAARGTVRPLRLRLRQRRGRPPGRQSRVRRRGHRVADHDRVHPDGLPADPDLRHPRHARGRRLLRRASSTS